MDEARLQEQAHRNALRAQQQMAEIRAYEKAYGKVRKYAVCRCYLLVEPRHIGDEHFVNCSVVVPSSEVEMYG